VNETLCWHDSTIAAEKGAAGAELWRGRRTALPAAQLPSDKIPPSLGRYQAVNYLLFWVLLASACLFTSSRRETSVVLSGCCETIPFAAWRVLQPNHAAGRASLSAVRPSTWAAVNWRKHQAAAVASAPAAHCAKLTAAFIWKTKSALSR
jgi:hypothetical protein